MHDLGTLGGPDSYAFGINNSGQVVGWLNPTGSSTFARAFIYDSTNGMRNLNSLIPADSGWTLQVAYSTNDAGQIVGYGAHNGQTRAFLLTPANSQAPTANDQSVNVKQDTPKNITLSASDPKYDPLTFMVVSEPTSGMLSGTAPDLTYTPNAGYTGSDSFTFTANDGTTDSNTATVSLTVNAPGSSGTLSSLTLTPTSVTGGCQTSTGKVTLTAAAGAGGTAVLLMSNNGAASVAASVVVPSGQTSTTFTITTRTVGTQQRPVITAKLGTSQKSATLTVKVITLLSLTLNPTVVKGGVSSTATVKQSCISQNGGTLVTLKSSAPAVAQPAVGQLTIPQGVQTETFTVTTTPQTIRKTASVSATANGSTKSAALTVNP